jgi:hypothetical protein
MGSPTVGGSIGRVGDQAPPGIRSAREIGYRVGAFVGRHDRSPFSARGPTRSGHGRGGAVWVEARPGSGSPPCSRGPRRPGKDCERAWGQADELTERFPHRVILDCLRIESRSADPARAVIAATLRGEQPGSLLVPATGAGRSPRACSTWSTNCARRRPLVLVVDDLHFADDASLTLWRRLAATVVTAAAPGVVLPAGGRPRRVERGTGGGRRRPRHLLAVPPLDPRRGRQLVTELVGAPPGRPCARLTAHATGNPLYPA